MLIEITEAPIKVDGLPLIENVRLNVQKNHQLRFKGTYIPLEKTHTNTSVDVVVYNWSTPKLDGLRIGMTIDGKEMTRNIEFKWKLSFDFLKRAWKLNGSFGPLIVERDLDSVGDILLVLRDLVV